MIEALHKFGPYIVVIPGIALAHAEAGSTVMEECMSMMTLKEPIAFGHESNDPVSVVFVIASNTKDKHLGSFDGYVKTFDEKRIHSITK